MNAIIFIYDVATGGIICSASSYTHARALVSGLLNARSYSYLKKEKPDWTYNYNDPHIHYCVEDGGIGALPERFKTEEWANFRKFMFHKSYCLEYWEFSCMKVVSRIDEYFSDYFSAYINVELAKCDPAQNLYTDAVKEYAFVQEIPIDAAYRELHIKNHHKGIVHTRSYAVYLKGVREINQQKTFDDVQHTTYGLINSLMKTSFS